MAERAAAIVLERSTQLDTETLREALTTFADDSIAVGTLGQCSCELNVLLAAMHNGCSDQLVQTTLLGIANRMSTAADVAQAHEQEPRARPR